VSYEEVLQDFFGATGADPERGSKVLWLFARDFLRLPAFPVDRWVGRALKDAGLPLDSFYMTKACLLAHVSPNKLSRALFGGVNPDWSAYQPGAV